jgi:hypothetical protein
MSIQTRSSTKPSACPDAACPDAAAPGELLTGRIAEVRAWLSGLDAADLSDRDRIRVVTALEELGGSAAGAQARMTAAYADSQRRLGCSVRGVAAEVGLARRVGLSRAARLVAASRTLVADLPQTLEHLESGRLSEARAVTVAGPVADLDPAQRREVDALLADALPRLGDAEVRDAVEAAIIGIDPDAVEARRRTARRRRRVTVRPADDGMAWLSIHTTAVEAAAALTTLHAHADAVLAGTGGLADVPDHAEGRTRPQVMVDAALSRLTGRSLHQGPPVEVQLVMTDTALLPPRTSAPAAAGAPAHSLARVVGAVPFPAGVARDLIRPRPALRPDPSKSHSERPNEAGSCRLFEGPDWEFADGHSPRLRRDEREATRVTLRRVHASPEGRNPVAVDARRRLMPAAARDPDRRGDPGVRAWFARLRAPAHPDELASLTSPQRCARGLLRLLVILRDQRCRAPWCTAPIRHLDHTTPHRDRPVTDAAGLAGACAGHNLAKEDPGHTVTVAEDGIVAVHPHTITWATPTGHTYAGVAPPVLGWGTTPASTEADPTHGQHPSPLEAHLSRLLSVA